MANNQLNRKSCRECLVNNLSLRGFEENVCFWIINVDLWHFSVYKVASKISRGDALMVL